MTGVNPALGWGERWPAPAKLNLMLRIVGRREDGYHLLQTVFQFVDLCDWLAFQPDATGAISLKNPTPGVSLENDLCVRAAHLLQQATGSTQGVCIDLEKNLPMGGGLGGGSSDAATVLVVLNQLWQSGLSTEALMKLGLQLGADVPIFVYGFAAWAEGVGEKFERIEIPERWLVIIKPDCHVDTRQIFLDEALTRDSKLITIADFIDGCRDNDCLDVVVDHYKQVRSAMIALAKFAESRLTGTGACVFAEFDNESEAKAAFNALKPDWKVYLSKGLNISPLQSKLQKR